MPGNDRNCTSVPAALSRSALSFPKWCPTTTSASPCAMSTLVALLAADTTDVALRSGSGANATQQLLLAGFQSEALLPFSCC